MQNGLYLKHRIIGTPIQRPLSKARWILGAPNRARNPELAAMHQEHLYVDHALHHLLRPDWNCVDGGSHIGSVLAEYVHHSPQGRHLAVEPVPHKAAWLRARYPGVDVQQVALGETPGTHVFFEDPDRPGFSSLRPLAAGQRSVRYDVRISRLDDLVGDCHIDFVKLDLEGAELPALRGATALLARDRPVVLFECGVQSAIDAFGYERTDVWDFLTDAGYDMYLAQDFVFGRERISRDEFRRAGTYPFPGFNYFALPAGTTVERLR